MKNSLKKVIFFIILMITRLNYFPITKIHGILLKSGTVSFFHCATVLVLIYSSLQVIPAAIQSFVSGFNEKRIVSIIFEFLYGVSIKI